jgi:uroporphyrinogen-III synthase
LLEPLVQKFSQRRVIFSDKNAHRLTQNTRFGRGSIQSGRSAVECQENAGGCWRKGHHRSRGIKLRWPERTRRGAVFTFFAEDLPPALRAAGGSSEACEQRDSGKQWNAMSGFDGLRVLALESRRAAEIAKLIATYGGQPTVAPSMREVPLESNKEAVAFAAALLAGEFEMVIFLTGVGARALLGVVETVHDRGKYVAALQRVTVVARGPKPVVALREIGITPAITAPEPNTWHELLRALDEAGKASPELGLQGARVAVQEYGVSNPELLSGLRERGAAVTRVPVYQWALPHDLGPLRAAISAITERTFEVALFTTAVQAIHLFQVAAEMMLEESVREGLNRAVVASIGPTTSEELRRQGIQADLEPSHPKMGYLVKEASEQAAELLRRKKAGIASAGIP